MRTQTWLATAASAIVFSLCVSCNDVEWPEPEYITSLRVLGVHAEPPSLTPGSSTRLSIQCVDGRPGPGKDPRCVDLEVAWFAQCNNPPKNDPTKCFERYASWNGSLASEVAVTPIEAWPAGFGLGQNFDITAPASILSEEIQVSKHTLRFGTSYVFFAACAGKLVAVHGVSDRLPLECRERTSGRLLGQRDFVVGYTTLYSYDSIRNANPTPLNPRFDGMEFPSTCSSEHPCPSGFECSSDASCIPIVAPCNRSRDCPIHFLDFQFDRTSFELTALDGTPIVSPQKSVWLNYYTNAGNLPLESTIALFPPKAPASVSISLPGIGWRAPQKPTDQAHIWAVIRDDRGGLTVWDQRVIVR